MTRTFIDSGVLIAAARGLTDVSQRAMSVLDDPDREFASSAFVRLEVLPKPIFHRRTSEAAFYSAFFDNVTHWAEINEHLVSEALRLASEYGLSAVDALHVAAAEATGATELITVEKPDKPLHRVRSLKVTSIQVPTAP